MVDGRKGSSKVELSVSFPFDDLGIEGAGEVVVTRLVLENTTWKGRFDTSFLPKTICTRG